VAARRAFKIEKCLHGIKVRFVLGPERVWGRDLVRLIPSGVLEIELKSLILAQIERWRHALHMQVERQRGGNPGGERRTGE
jgi:hypothetical protein